MKLLPILVGAAGLCMGTSVLAQTMYSPTPPPTFQDAQCFDDWCEAYSDTYGFSIETNSPDGPYGDSYDPPADTVAYVAPADDPSPNDDSSLADPPSDPSEAPEIAPGGATGALTLLLGIAAIMRGKRHFSAGTAPG